MTKCAESLQRLVVLQRAEGARSQIVAALSLYLPTSKYHPLLSRLPFPDQTSPQATTTFAAELAVHVEALQILDEVIQLTEAVERDLVDKEVEKRRTRMDSASKSREALRNEVGVEIWRQSKVRHPPRLLLTARYLTPFTTPGSAASRTLRPGPLAHQGN